MTLSGMMRLALRQLGEQPEDISEYDELFRSYANMGYMIAVRQYLRPREIFQLTTDKQGRADIRALPVIRAVQAWDPMGREMAFDLAPDGQAVITGAREAKITLLCETDVQPMQAATDEPQLPEYVHPAIADYICYRHLSSGNLAKQRRAEFFYQSFCRQMRAMKPHGAGSVTRRKNLYGATEVNAYGGV